MPSGRKPRAGASSLATGALALAVAGVLAKGLSAVGRILFARWLGAEAIGLYEMAMPILALGISVCGLGIPVAAAALLGAAVGRGNGPRVAGLLRASRLLLTGTGVAGGLAVVVFAPDLARMLGNPAATPALRAVGPAIVLANVLSGEKSWLQASGRTAPSAGVVTVEQCVRVAVAVMCAYAFLGRGALVPAMAAAALAWSPAAGATAGLLATAVAARRPWRLPARPEGEPGDPVGAHGPARALMAVGGPNWVSSILASGSAAIDAALVTWRLRLDGMGAAGATAALGELNGMATPLATASAVLFGALGSALMPAVAADWARGDGRSVRRRGEAAYFWVSVAALPCILLLWQLAQPICRLLYHNAAAAAPLRFLAFDGLPLGITYVAGALANAAGRPAALLPGVVIGSVVRSVLILVLAGGVFGIRGAAAAVLTGFIISAGLNLHAVGRLIGCWPPWGKLAAITVPALAAQVAASTIAWGALAGWLPGVRVFVTVATALAAYGCTLALAWAVVGDRLRLPGIPWPR